MNWPNQQQLVAKEHCCEEAHTMSAQFYIPCNQPATKIIGWKGRTETPIRMCEMCADHNVKNRNGYFVEAYNSPTVASQAWPKETMKFDAAMAKPSNPLDSMSEDDLLMLWQKRKDAIETAKADEMELRKYIVGRAFPQKTEGMNNKELGNGYTLKAGIKYNYNLADNDTVEAALDKISKLGNQGPFIADRLVSWKPNFLLTEYRQLQDDAAKGEQFAKSCLKEVESMLTITEAAPSLEIKEPKAKKGK